MIIYALIDPRNDNISYIGFTRKNIAERLRAHSFDRGNTPKIDWLNKLKSLGLLPKIEKIEDVNENNWQKRERFWIQYFKNEGFKLKNYTDGGETGPYRVGHKLTKEHARNSGMGKRKTTEEQDKIIREEYLSGRKNCAELSEEFKISRTTVTHIAYGRLNSYEEKPNVIRRKDKFKVPTKEDIIEIRKRYKESKVSLKVLACIYSIDPSTVSRIVNYKNYKSIKID